MLGVNLSDYLGNRCSGSDYIYNSLGNPRVYIYYIILHILQKSDRFVDSSIDSSLYSDFVCSVMPGHCCQEVVQAVEGIQVRAVQITAVATLEVQQC